MKKLSFFLMAMLISLVSFAEEATLSFADKTQRISFSTTQQVWEQNGITFTNDKASSSNDVADYANPVRLYQGSTISVECGNGNITKIVFATNASKYVSPMQNSLESSLGAVTISGNNVTLTLSTPAAAIKAISLTAQVRLNSITVTYEKAQSTEPTITCSNAVSFGVVQATNTNTKELTVEAENLAEDIVASLANGTAFAVEGALTTAGGTLTLTVTATEEGTYTDVLTLTSGATTKEVTISATVIVCQGQGTKEVPYSISDVIKLANPNPLVTAWVEGYIIGSMENNEIAEENVNYNIVLADAADDAQTIIPVQLPSGEVRTALNLADNPSNMGAKVAVYGTLENYSSLPGVKNVSDYVILTAPVDGPTTGVDNVEATVAAKKAIVNGQLIIVKDGVKFNALGQVIK